MSWPATAPSEPANTARLPWCSLSRANTNSEGRGSSSGNRASFIVPADRALGTQALPSRSCAARLGSRAAA